jgi:hypothetical protein
VAPIHIDISAIEMRWGEFDLVGPTLMKEAEKLIEKPRRGDVRWS